MQNQLTSKQIAEREALLAHGLPDDYNEEVEEMNGEEDPRSRKERHLAAKRERQKESRRKKAALKLKKSRERRNRRKKARR